MVPLLSDPSFNVDCIDLYAKFYVRLLNNQLSDAVARRELWIAAVEAASSISYDQRQARTLIHLMQQASGLFLINGLFFLIGRLL